MKRRLSFLLGFLVGPCVLFAAENQTEALPPSTATKAESIVLGGGCFWCLDAAYRLVPGVVSVESGYSGGRSRNPSYREVCSGDTGHAEVVRVVYDSSVVSLQRLFELFWKVHDPTTLNRQGNDVGTQYRSVIMFSSPQQKLAAEQAIKAAAPRFSDPIVTEVSPLGEFWRAEDYHQDYYTKNPGQGYCQAVVRVKVDKMRKALAKEPGH